MNSRKKRIFYILVFISVFKPAIFNYWDFVDLLANGFSILFFLLFLSLFLLKFIKKREVNKMTILIMLLHIIVFLSTYFHQGNIKHWGMALVSSGTLAFFLELYAEDIKNIIINWFPVVELFLLFNIISIFTGGIENDDWLTDYFLGSKNTFEVVFASYLVVIYLYGKSENSNIIHLMVCYSLMIIAIMMTRSSTMLIEFGVFVILLFIKEIPLIRRLVEYRYLLSIFIVSNFALILYALNTDLDIIVDYLEYETDKGSSSLGVRLEMWIAGMDIIINNPLFGIGRMSEDMWILLVNVGDYKTQLHNQIIEYLVSGGIILLIVLFSIYYLAAYNLHKYGREGVVILLTLVCFSLNIANMMEAYYNALFYFPFLLTGYLPYITESKFSFVPAEKFASYNDGNI